MQGSGTLTTPFTFDDLPPCYSVRRVRCVGRLGPQRHLEGNDKCYGFVDAAQVSDDSGLRVAR